MNKFFSVEPVWQSYGLGLIRIIVGMLMIYHGFELFNSEIMNGYCDWDQFRNTASGKYLVYGGKIAELLAGVSLLIGLFTRIGALILILSMLFIISYVGRGRVWYEDQHPFLFVLLGLVFIFCGPGSWSVDKYAQKAK